MKEEKRCIRVTLQYFMDAALINNTVAEDDIFEIPLIEEITIDSIVLYLFSYDPYTVPQEI